MSISKERTSHHNLTTYTMLNWKSSFTCEYVQMQRTKCCFCTLPPLISGIQYFVEMCRICFLSHFLWKIRRGLQKTISDWRQSGKDEENALLFWKLCNILFQVYVKRGSCFDIDWYFFQSWCMKRKRNNIFNS